VHHPANVAFSRWTLAAALVLVGASAAPLRAQIQAPLAGGGGTGLLVYTVPSMDPNRLPLTGPYPVSYWVVNTGLSAVTPDFTCSVAGPLTCANVSPISATISPGDSLAVGLTYSTLTGPGAGSVALIATVEGATPPTSAGSRSVGVYNEAKGRIILFNPNQDNIDRGLCLTVGAGEGGALSCGDLVLTYGMPAYRSLGRDRSLTLHYNSATATGLNLVAAEIVEPGNVPMPTSIRVILRVYPPSGGTLKDSTVYTPPAGYTCGFVGCADTFQVVVGKNLALSSDTTAYYPADLEFVNVYPSVLKSDTVRANLLIVNRRASEYGRGWGLLGVEQLLFPADSTQRVWLAGDGSARVYHRGAGVTSGQLTAAGMANWNAVKATNGLLTDIGWKTTVATDTTARVLVNFGAAFPRAVTTLRVYSDTSGATYKVQCTNDTLLAWTTVLTGFRPLKGWSVAAWSSPGTYRYWRLKVTANNSITATVRELSWGNPNNFYAAPGDAPDSLVRFTNGGQTWYRRNLKHGAKVEFDPAGRHRTTTNRVGAVTSFYWSAASPVRLDSVNVPPSGVPRRTYRLFWNAGTRLLDSIRDPGGRRLRAVMSGGNLTKLVAPGNLDSLRFAYDARNVLVKRIATRQRNTTKGDSAVTTYAYLNSARVTQVAVQADSAGATAVTGITPWDERGLTTLVEVDTAPYGLATRIDGPRTGTGDAADFWVTRLGTVTRSRELGTDAITTLARDSVNSLPALVTRIDYPNGWRVRQAWTPRGNLAETRDSTCHQVGGCSPAQVATTTYAYADPDAPDSPSLITDPLNRTQSYSYDSLGMLELATDARGHQTRFWIRPSGALKGLVDSVAELQVQTLRYYTMDTDEVLNQVVRLTYDARGNPATVKNPVGVTTAVVADSLGRPVTTYDPFGGRTQYVYDALNRVTQTARDSAQFLPPGVDPWAGCDGLQVQCGGAVQTPTVGPSLITTGFHGPVGLDSVGDPRGVKRRYRYDAAGRLVRDTDEFLQHTRLEFDAVGQILRRLGRVNATFDDQDTVRYSHDGMGRLTGARMNRTYHWFTAWDADTVTSDSVTFTYDLVGRRIAAANRQGTILRGYYLDGALRHQVTVYATGRDSAAYDYNAAGQRTRLSRTWIPAIGSAMTDVTTYAYTGNGDLQIIATTWQGGTTTSIGFTWDALGRRRTVTYPGSSGTITANYRYDGLGLLRRISSTNPADPGTGFDNLDFTVRLSTVDGLGRNTLRVTDCGGQGSGNPCGPNYASGLRVSAKSVTSAFDRFGWLVTQSSSPGPDETYRYDKSGNRVARLDPVNGNHHYTYLPAAGGAASNVLASDSVAGVSPSQVDRHVHDANGSRSREYHGAAPFETVDRRFYYDAQGRMAGVRDYDHYTSGQVDCTWYDAEGRMVHSCPNGTPRAIYDGDNVAALDAERWVFIHGPGLDDPLVGMYRSGTATQLYFYVTDGQGQQLAVATPDGSLSGSAENVFTSWGGTLAGGTGNATTFAGSRLEAATAPGVSYFRNRTYDQQTGRWLQEDPIGMAGGVNLYQYNGNDPVAYADPFGLRPEVCPPCLIAGAAADALMVVGAAIIVTAATADISNKVANQELVPTHTPRPTAGERRKVNEIGDRTGCMTCGTKNPGTTTGNWVANHVPPTSLAMPAEPQYLGPHCTDCSNKQGGWLRQVIRRLGEALSGGSNGPPALPAGATQVEDNSGS
jgi:RHS repeat-associated protein